MQDNFFQQINHRVSLTVNKIGRRKGRFPLHHDEPYSPLYIVGSGRCGSTLLRRMLNTHPQLYIPPEFHCFNTAFNAFRVSRTTLGWKQLVNLIVASYEYGESDFQWEGRSLREGARKLYTANPESRTLATILNGIYLEIALIQGKSPAFWGDKTVSNAFRLDLINKIFPRMKVIHILRDGVDVVSSFLEMGRYQEIEAAANRWLESVTAIQSFMDKNPRTCLEVRYEKLVEQPNAELLRICDFLELEYKPAMLGSDAGIYNQDLINLPHLCKASKPIETNSIGKGREKLNGVQKGKMKQLFGKKLLECGYRAP